MLVDTEREAAEQKIYATDGVVRLGPVLDASELELARVAIDRAFFAGSAVAAGVRDLSERRGQPLNYGLLQKVNLWQADPFFARLVRRADLVRRVARMIGGPLRLFRDHAFYKPGGKGEHSHLGLHQDNRYWHLDPPAAATVWLALDDSTVENGCVHYLPGSHTARADHVRTDPDAILVEVVDAADPIPYPVRAGEALLHHAQVVHGSPPNRTDRPRRAYGVVYMRADVCVRGESATAHPLLRELIT
jgi:Phytanoyl-CoA dioxygenase (PhyH)